MVLVGWGSVLLGGCPLRQLILAAQGNGDSAVTVFGMIVGAALAHNFGLAGNPDSKNEAGQLVVGGISTAGKVAVIVGMVTSVIFYQKSFLTATLLGLGIALVVYGILIFARKNWRELAFKSGKIEEVKVGRKKRK